MRHQSINHPACSLADIDVWWIFVSAHISADMLWDVFVKTAEVGKILAHILFSFFS